MLKHARLGPIQTEIIAALQTGNIKIEASDSRMPVMNRLEARNFVRVLWHHDYEGIEYTITPEGHKWATSNLEVIQ